MLPPIINSEKDNSIRYIDWEENDPQHPQNWPTKTKWAISISVMMFTFVSSSMPAGYHMAFEGFREEYGTSREIYMLGITFFLLFHAFGPMALSPISETIGRFPVMIISSGGNLILFLGNICATNVTTLIVTRALQGIIGSSSNCMSGGFMADMFSPRNRGIVLSCYNLVYFGALSLSPMWSSWVAFKLSWRLIFWIQGASCLFSFILLAVFLRETRPDVLLANRAKRLTKSTGVEHRTKFMDANPTILQAIQTSVSRPFLYLFTEPIVTFYSLWLALVTACTYFLLSAIPIIFARYGWNLGLRGLPHLGTFCGVLIGFALSITVQERLYRRDRLRCNKDTPAPESRLYMAMVGAILFPLGAVLLSVTCAYKVDWIWPVISIGIIAIGCYSINLSGYTYLSDAYETYASSALAASAFLKSLFASVVPLFARHIVKKYGEAVTCASVAGIATLLGLLPFVLMWKGQQLRSYSRAAVALARGEAEKVHRLSSAIVVEEVVEKETSFTLHGVRHSAGSEDARSLHDSMLEEPTMAKY